MRTSGRTVFLILLAGLWPQLGCHQLPGGKSVQELRPLEKKDASTSAKHELSAAEVAKSLVEQAKALEDARKLAEAVAMYEKIRTTDPSQAWHATKRLALIYLHHNELDRAEQEFQRLRQANPRDADTLCNLGDISYRRGHWGLAEKNFRDALSSKPDHTHAIINLGMTLAQREQYQESLDTFKRVFNEAEAQCQVAWVMNVQGKHEEAMRTYQTVLSRQPDLQRARDGLAQVYQAHQSVAVRLTTPHKTASRGVVELEPSGLIVGDATGRLMNQRPTLPPLPEFDLGETSGREWQSSAKK